MISRSVNKYVLLSSLSLSLLKHFPVDLLRQQSHSQPATYLGQSRSTHRTKTATQSDPSKKTLQSAANGSQLWRQFRQSHRGRREYGEEGVSLDGADRVHKA